MKHRDRIEIIYAILDACSAEPVPRAVIRYSVHVGGPSLSKLNEYLDLLIQRNFISLVGIELVTLTIEGKKMLDRLRMLSIFLFDPWITYSESRNPESKY